MVGPRNIDELHEMASRPSREVVAAMQCVDSDILVVGAGGKMGFHLSRMLHRALTELPSKHRVIAVSRFGSAGATDLFAQFGIDTIRADLTQPAAIASLPRSNNLIYLAGVKFGTSANPELLEQLNVVLPSRIGQRFADARIVALSTGCVYAFTTPASGGSTESDPLTPPGDYAISCIGREQAFARCGARTSLIRLNYSIDLRYGVLVDLAQKVLRQQPIDLTTGFFNVIWQGDANAYILQALARAAVPPFVVNVTGREVLRVRDVATRFGEIFDKEVTFTGTEAETAWLSNARKSHALWGAPTVSEDDLITWVATWLQAGGATLNKPTQFEVRDGTY
jgi:nucleoside-diphosphate-sugar epimerase